MSIRASEVNAHGSGNFARSRVRLSGGRYLWHRFLRILPAFWICLLLVAFVAAPLSTVWSGESWKMVSSFGYIRHNALLWIGQFNVRNTLMSVPFPGAWNGSLWTLFYEFSAFLFSGLLLWPNFVRRHAAPLFAACLGLGMLLIPLANGPLHLTTNLYLNFLRLGTFYLAGMAIWSMRERMRAWVLVAAFCGAVVFILYFQSSVLFSTLAPLPLAYLLLWLGGVLPTRVGAKNDISYGVYIYAFPVQQLLALAGVQRFGVIPMMVASTICTIPLAWSSWVLVERPAMRLKGWRSAPRVAAAI